MILKIVFLLSMAVAIYAMIPKMKKSYSIEMDHLEAIEVPEADMAVNFGVLRVTKFNRTVWVVIANISILAEDLTKIDIAIFSNLMQANVYKRQPYAIPIQPVCQFWKTIYKDQLYEALKTTSNLPAPEDCPPKEKEFWVKDYIFNEENTNLPPHMDIGKWRLDLVLSQGGKPAGGLMFYMNTVKVL